MVERTLKLIVSIAKWPNIPHLKTGLLLANTQAVRQIIKRKIFHLYQLLLTLQDWQYYKEDNVPNQEHFIEKLYNAKIHLNLDGEICARWPLFPILVKSDKVSLRAIWYFW